MIIRYSRNNLECYFRVNSGLSISISISEIVITYLWLPVSKFVCQSVDPDIKELSYSLYDSIS